MTALSEDDDGSHINARLIIEWLNGDRHLLRASQCDGEAESQELLRPVVGARSETDPDTLLRAVDELNANIRLK